MGMYFFTSVLFLKICIFFIMFYLMMMTMITMTMKNRIK
jgi:hypothetical protein